MALAETANLLVKLSLQDDVSATSSKVKGSLGDLGKTALGLAGAAGFGALTKGALDAEAAQGKFMAATGKSREEAKQFVSSMDGLAGSAGTVGMKFEDLAALGTTVEQQFGTTGQKTQDLTENIAEFAKVTGTDAEQAAGDLEDTLSSYGLSADDARGFMDELVASNQKFGTEAGPAALDALRNMSPALQTMGGDLTDGVGFLNLFETAGLDAGAAATGLNKAVKELKPGQTVDDLIAQIGSIEDPTLKAQKAIELFGSKAGPKLALAIQPGMTSLDDFKVSAEEAAGKTQKAADDMLTFGDRIKGFADKAMAGAREVGQELGPAITGLASLSSLAAPFAKGIGSMLKDMLPDALKSATATGVAIGEAEAAGSSSASVLQKFTGSGNLLGKALGLGIVAGVGLVLADQLIQVTQQVKTQVENDPNGINNVQLFQGRAPMWAAAKINAAKGMQDLGAAALAAFNKTWDEGIAKGMSPSDPALLDAAKAAGTAAGNAAGSNAATATVGTYADQMRESKSTAGFADAAKHAATTFFGVPDWEIAGKKAAVTTSGAFAVSPEWMATSRAAAEKITDAFNQKVLSERGTAQSAWEDFVNMMKHPLDTAAELAKLKGELASKKMLQGLNSNDPQVRQWAENTRDAIEGRINDLTQLLGQDGTDAGQAFTNHLQGQADNAAAAAASIKNRVNAQLSLIDTYIKIIIDKEDRTGQGPVGHGHRAEGGPVKKGVAYIVGEQRPELFVPDADGTIIPRLPNLSRPTPYLPPGSFQPPPIAIQVSLSTRGVDREMDHYRYVQGRTR